MFETRHPPVSILQRRPRGVALLMVLLIVMAITVIAMGFVTRADVELACGSNMLLRLQMDQLAVSGLEHAKGLLLHPQDVNTPYWPGAASQQLMVAQSSDYYDVTVARDVSDYCTYDVTCDAYRLQEGQRIGESRLAARFRLDPCLGLWTGADLMFRPTWSCYGDLYGAGTVDNRGTIDGDVFAGGPFSGTRTGQLDPQPLTLTWPPVTTAYFNPQYTTFPISSGSLTSQTLQPPHVWSYTGDLTIGHNVMIEGMLLVHGKVTFAGAGSTIIAPKNLPALYTSGDLVFRGASNVQITGLAVVDGGVFIRADTTDLRITGALFAKGRIVEMAVDASGNGNDAVLHSQPSLTAGRSGGALTFDGADDYLQTPDSATQLQLVNDYTFSVWTKPAPTQNAWAAIVCKTDTNGANHWTLQFGNTAPRTLMVYHSTSTWDTGITLSALADGAWHHVAVVRLGNNMASYLDGVPCTTGALTQVPGTGDGHVNIGADRTASPDYLYAGSLDELRIYDCALGQTDVEKLYALQHVNSAVPSGHWGFDEAGSGATIRADPAAASIVVSAAQGIQYWGPAVDGFFRSISRGVTP